MILPIKSLLLLLSSSATIAEETWRFIVLADWHGAESFSVRLDNEADHSYYLARDVLKEINGTYGGDLMLLPGDTQTGHWYQGSYRRYLETELGLSGLTLNETVSIAAENCYNSTKKLFAESGYEKILVAFGDHELGEFSNYNYSMTESSLIRLELNQT